MTTLPSNAGYYHSSFVYTGNTIPAELLADFFAAIPSHANVHVAAAVVPTEKGDQVTETVIHADWGVSAR